MSRLVLTGTSAVPGIGIGYAYLHATASPGPDLTDRVAIPQRAEEIRRLHSASQRAAEQLAGVADDVRRRLGEVEAAVFEAQALFLQDPALTTPIEEAVLQDGLSAGAAVQRTMTAAAEELASLADPYLSARSADLRDVMVRLLQALEGERGLAVELPADTILVADDLTPSDTVNLDTTRVRGIALAGGTATSHAVILARGLGIPLVMGLGAAVRQIQPLERVVLDGDTGTVITNPESLEWEQYDRVVRHRRETSQARRAQAVSPLVTRDGHRVHLLANASSAGEAHLAVENHAEGIGLLRTELLLAALAGRHGPMPAEEQLSASYEAILTTMAGKPCVVRAMDAGGDKPLPFLDFGQEANPFLGWRGIRILLDEPAIFAAQIRALLRAAERTAADLRLMFPMVMDVGELRRACELVAAVIHEAKIQLTHPLQVGVMIEVPAAALGVPALAVEADFFSIGTNDLTQYTLACDRGNARVSALCDPVHPAVLRLIDLTVRAAHAAGRPVGVCGEAAGDLLVAPLLIGLGVDELSVGAARLMDTRRHIEALDFDVAQRVSQQALTCATAAEVRELLRQ